MARPNDIVVIDDDSEGEEVLEAAGSDPNSLGVNNTRPGSTPNSGPSCGRSPLLQQQEVSRGSRDASAARQLYQDGFYIDDRALAERLRNLEASGKAPMREEPVKDEEDSEREPTDDDIAALELQLANNSSLLQQLSRGEGSSSNPQHLWRLRVYQALLQQQEQLFSQAQQRDYAPADSEQEEIPDSENDGSEEEAPPPAKKRRATGPPSSAAAAGGAGSSKAAAAGGAGSSKAAATGGAGSSKAAATGGAGSSKEPAAKRQRREPVGPASSGPSSSQPGSSDQPQQQQQQQQQQQPRRPPAASKPPRHNQQQPRMPAGRNNAAAAAAAGDGGGSGGGSFTEREEQRRLRGQLAQMEATVEAKHEELIDTKNCKLLGCLMQLGELGEQAKRPREGAQHAGVMAKVIKSGVDMINHYSNASKGRSAAQLTAAVRSIFALDHAAASTRDGPVSVNWEALGQASSHLFRTVPGLGSMLGALESQAKVRKQVVRQKRAVLEPEVRPKDGSDALRQEHGLGQETERVVTDMRRVLERVGSCSLIALVLDHDSFAHTLENVFALSFLCKDMYVGLEEDQAAGLIVRHISKERRVQLQREHDAAAAAGGRGGRLNPHQFMMELDMALWNSMKAVVPRAETDMLMPQRLRTHH